MGHAGVTPFTVNVPEPVLADLRDRLARTRWPDEIPGAGWDYGVSPSFLRELMEYWRTGFDWRVHESRLNDLENVSVEIDGLRMHAIHQRGNGPNPLPLLITHGWPSTCYEAIDLIGLLAEPDDPADAFDVVVPSLPGFGFSQIPSFAGLSTTRKSEMLVRLMAALGYDRFGAHAYDVGASMLSAMCVDHPDRIIGYHTTEPENAASYTAPAMPPFTEAEHAYRELQDRWYAEEGGYDLIQATRPQTLAYGLNDSPAGLAAWILDKWYTWTEPWDGDLTRHFTADQLLANVTIYWATGTINSANRGYYEREHHRRVPAASDKIRVPTGVALTTQAIERAPREYLERFFTDIRYWRDLGAGGHFVMLERPELIADSIRTFFRQFR